MLTLGPIFTKLISASDQDSVERAITSTTAYQAAAVTGAELSNITLHVIEPPKALRVVMRYEGQLGVNSIKWRDHDGFEPVGEVEVALDSPGDGSMISFALSFEIDGASFTTGPFISVLLPGSPASPAYSHLWASEGMISVYAAAGGVLLGAVLAFFMGRRSREGF